LSSKWAKKASAVPVWNSASKESHPLCNFFWTTACSLFPGPSRRTPCNFEWRLRQASKTEQQGGAVNQVTYDILTQRIKLLGNLPAMPAILATLCEALSRKTSQIDMEKIVRQISYDKSLAAQRLRMANSALFRQRGDVSTVKDAVVALGLWRIRDLVFSCSLPMMFAHVKTTVGKEVFWRHSLGTAAVAQGLGYELGAQFPEDVYLAGLLHDIGVLVNGMLFTEDFRDVLVEAMETHRPLELVEQRILGFTHAESGRILAELWRLPVELAEVIEHHTDPQKQKAPNDVTELVHAADLACLNLDLGYGYQPDPQEETSLPHIWKNLGTRFPIARSLREETFSELVVHLISEAEKLADHVFTPVMSTR
jgi:HD-like signal output (HDOD) protein